MVRWGQKKGRHASWRPVREIAREEIAILSSFVAAARRMVQWAPIRH
jgi:hypothetical protein